MSKKKRRINEVVNEVEEAVENEAMVSDETVDTPDETVGKLSKVKDGVKRHGKKILTGVGIVTAGVILYTLGRKKSADVIDVDAEDSDDWVLLEARDDGTFVVADEVECSEEA